ncbi:MAG: type I restriction-modification system subunit M N-terminal domain-containing protein [Pyrinomonadaceae bacterium]|nr:type I restriction-modification system subunit M N-terminal domain-containing protein [Pyrinomonadaceae bacterium]
MNKEQLKQLEADLWRSADTLRANSDLKASEYSTPVLGLIFLKFADNIYTKHEAAITAEYLELKGSRREKDIHEIAIEKCGFYLPSESRYDYLLNLSDDQDISAAIKKAMQLIEDFKPELADILPKNEYARFNSSEDSRGIPRHLLRNFSNIPSDTEADLFGQIYEYFLAEFAMAEGQGGGEFFTPRSVVRLMVEMIEPIRGEIFDLLKKPKLTKTEEQRVKLAAKALLRLLKSEPPPVLIQNWHMDVRSTKRVRRVVEEILDKELPESYDTALFREKCDHLLDSMVEYAHQGRKWLGEPTTN